MKIFRSEKETKKKKNLSKAPTQGEGFSLMFLLLSIKNTMKVPKAVNS